MLLRRGIISSGLDDGGNITGNYNTAEGGLGRYAQYTNSVIGTAMDTVNISYGGWFYIDSTGTNVNNYLLNSYSSNGSFSSRYDRTAGIIKSFQRIGATTNQVTAAVNEDELVHYMGTYDGTTGKLYINGSLISSSVALSGNLVALAGLGVRCGRQNNVSVDSNDFEGSYTLMCLYGSALSAGEVTSIYNGGLALLPEDFPSGIKAKITMACPLTDAVVDPLVDRSGNGFDAVLAGGITYTTPTIEFG